LAQHPNLLLEQFLPLFRALKEKEMALADKKSFYRFLKEAEVCELEGRKADVESLISIARSPKVIRDAKHLLSKIDEELAVRQEVALLEKK